MTPIIAGRFETQTEAEHSVNALKREGFTEQDITMFYVNPPGQHGTFPIGGDREASPGATQAHGGAIQGAAVGTAVGLGVGMAVTPLAGPAAAIVGASAGAYAGSLVGALGSMEEKPARDEIEPEAESISPQPVAELVKPVRAAGMMVAIRAPEFARRVAAANALRAAGARDIERADGTWHDGQWIDFDPLKSPLLVDLPAEENYGVRH
ncbi:MAG: glycine zipper family protein [Betaproteobacteria bacterium]|nr:MAG: glycine zipper family protein [Betaproteobacteria bacterium]